jgi:hypothetical protein
MNPLLSTETCATTVGSGIKTSWSMVGSMNAYADDLSSTDGYTITASFSWKLLTTNIAADSRSCDALTCAIGTCVETLD